MYCTVYRPSKTALMAEEEEPSCPICFESLDKTDLDSLPCGCGFQICAFCYSRIISGACVSNNARCVSLG